MAATAQALFEKVELRGEGELDKIQALLDEALEAQLQDAEAADLTDADRAELRATCADCIAQLRQFVVFSEEPEATLGGGPASTLRTQLTPPGAAASALHSPLLKPLSPPPADAEVQQLEAEVNEASRRVAELRTTMQAALQEQLAAKLAACRPSAELEQEAAAEASGQQDGTVQAEHQADGSGEQAQPGEQQQQEQQQAGVAAAAADGEQPPAAQPMEVEEPAAPAEALQLSPQPEELQQRLLAAANRMPALRARLEQATDRLQRVVAAVAADISRPPPNTVEKAVLGKTPGRPGAGGGAAANTAAAAAGEEENVPGVSPLLKQALESGQIETRRGRVPRDVQPVPYSQPE